jgi:hypothetical protein
MTIDSAQFLYATSTGQDEAVCIDSLKEISLQTLLNQLDTQEKQLAFWLNIYNAFTQIFLRKNPDLYKNKFHFFSRKNIQISGQKLSFDDIEHGILRHSQWKYGMGYVPKLFVGDFEKKFRIRELDFRIHFALNCGARSCPPIAAYKPEIIDNQLDLAMHSFLATETSYDSAQNKVQVSKIFFWFRGDFGGKRGILKILENQRLIPQNSKPSISFKNYDWKLDLEKWAR